MIRSYGRLPIAALLAWMPLTFFIMADVTGQPPASANAISLYRSGTVDTMRKSKTPSERASLYWQAAVVLVNEDKMDSASRALDKALRFAPADSLVRDNPEYATTMARLEQSRGRHLTAQRWAALAFEEARSRYPTDSLILVARRLHGFQSRSPQPDLAWRYRHFADSLGWEIQQTAAADSLAQHRFNLLETERRVKSLDERLALSEQEKTRWFYYALVPLAAATLALLLVVVLLAIRNRPNARRRNAGSPSATKAGGLVVQRGAAHTLTGYTDLLLQRGRTGDDLLVLKAMERELRRLRNTVTDNAVTPLELDDDRVMRSLKNIRLLICSDNSDAALLLKAWLRKRIRLCEIHELIAQEDLPAGFAPDVVIVDIDNVTDGNVASLVQLKQTFGAVPWIVLTATDAELDALKPQATLRKPFQYDALLHGLIQVYKPAEPSPEPTVSINVAEARDETPVALDAAVQYHCDNLERAFTQDDRNVLVESCRALDPLLQRAGIQASRWLDIIANKPEGPANVQMQLALKNVITYCRQAIASFRGNEG